MRTARHAAWASLVIGLVSGCGGGDPGATTPTLDVLPGASFVYVGASGVWIGARRSGGGAEPTTWTLDGPGSLSTLEGPVVFYTPPATGDAEARATITASAGTLRSSAILDIRPPPFSLSPAVLRVTAGAGMTPIEVVPRDPAAALAWSYSLDGPGAVDDWYAPPSVLFYPPESVATTTTAKVQVFAQDGRYATAALVIIEPRPDAGTSPLPPSSPATPPAGFGTAIISWNAVQETGTIRGWADASGDGVILWGPTTYVAAAAWPRMEGPAELVAPCVADSWTFAWETCSFHFTEMKVGAPIASGQVGGTWYFHGTFQATMNGGRDRVSATF